MHESDEIRAFARPLLLFCSPRGGSSLAAGVFVRHGFWVGDTFGGPGGVGSGGYVNHENARIKKYMKEHFPLNAGKHTFRYPSGPDFPNALRKFCEGFVPDRPWLFKGPSEYWYALRTAFPDSVAVCVFRDRTQAVEAHVRRYGEKVRENAAWIVEQRYAFMTGLVASGAAYRLDADRIVDGDLAQVEPILAQYEIGLDHRLAMDGISPEMFHR